MKKSVLIGIILIIIGIAILSYNQYSDRLVVQKEEKNIDVGPIQHTSEKRQTVPMTTVFGAIVIAGGIIYLIMRMRK